jgi:hypothetical protein
MKNLAVAKTVAAAPAPAPVKKAPLARSLAWQVRFQDCLVDRRLNWISIVRETNIKRIVAEVVAEQKRLHNIEADEVVLPTIANILTTFGIEEEDRAELRADFQHLRRWRKSVEQAQSRTFKAVITLLVTLLVSGWCGSASRSCSRQP